MWHFGRTRAMKQIFGFVVAGFLVPVSVHAQANGDACIRLDYADTLTWRRFQSDVGIASAITLADHTDAGSAAGAELYGFLVRGESGNCLKTVFADSASIADSCRDSVSGRIHTVLHTSAGQHSDVQIWSADPATGEPVWEYSEGWVDSYREGKWDLVAADGQCLWRERQDARKTIDDAFQALRVGAAFAETAQLSGADELPVRRLAAETVRHWLMSLEGSATIEGAVYAGDADRADWRVVQFRGNAICDAHGVVLVLNRRTGQWYAIHDVESGCSKSLDFPFYGMYVSEGHLIVSACTVCSHWGEYASFAISLETWRVRRLESKDLLEWDPYYKKNPRIQDVEQAVFGN